MRSITDVVRQFKQNWTQQLSKTGIAEAVRHSRMTWIASTLDPITTVQIFFLQILHGNTACEHMSHLARMTFTGAAYCKAPMRVKLEILELLLRRSVEQLQEDIFDTGRWLGHRVFFVDGSSFSMPDTPQLQAHFFRAAHKNRAADSPRPIGWPCYTRARG